MKIRKNIGIFILYRNLIGAIVQLGERSDIHRRGQEYKWKKGYVYILKRLKNGRYYIGSTKDVIRRIMYHESGFVRSTKYISPLELVFTKEFKDTSIARSLELKLKKLKSKQIIERIITENELTMGL